MKDYVVCDLENKMVIDIGVDCSKSGGTIIYRDLL